MRNSIGIVLVVLFCTFYVFGQKPESTRTNFTGTWVLDLVKTKDLPRELESYIIKVAQNDEKIGIKTEIKGELKSRGGGTGGNGGGGGTGGGGRGGRGGGGGESVSGPIEGARSFNGQIALGSITPEVVFDIDEKEIVLEMKNGATVFGKAKLKAKWKKDGKVLETTITKEYDMEGQKRVIPTHEKWEMSEDGKTLKITREISMPNILDIINLVFNKQN